jgi:hypothetical protein
VSQKEEVPGGLLDAALVLDDLAAGRVPDRARILSGVLALDTLRRAGIVNRDMLDAAAGLKAIARGGSPYLDETGRVLARALALAVRGFYASGEWEAWLTGGADDERRKRCRHKDGIPPDEAIPRLLRLKRRALRSDLAQEGNAGARLATPRSLGRHNGSLVNRWGPDRIKDGCARLPICSVLRQHAREQSPLGA